MKISEERAITEISSTRVLGKADHHTLWKGDGNRRESQFQGSELSSTPNYRTLGTAVSTKSCRSRNRMAVRDSFPRSAESERPIFEGRGHREILPLWIPWGLSEQYCPMPANHWICFRRFSTEAGAWAVGSGRTQPRPSTMDVVRLRTGYRRTMKLLCDRRALSPSDGNDVIHIFDWAPHVVARGVMISASASYLFISRTKSATAVPLQTQRFEQSGAWWQSRGTLAAHTSLETEYKPSSVGDLTNKKSFYGLHDGFRSRHSPEFDIFIKWEAFFVGISCDLLWTLKLYQLFVQSIHVFRKEFHLLH